MNDNWGTGRYWYPREADMSGERRAEGYGGSLLGSLFFWAFILIKAFGHTYAAWSWWWVLLPIVPVIGQLVIHFGF